MMRESKYWDDFSRRIDETITSIENNEPVKVRRVACFVTDRCNFRCKYCNSGHDGEVMSRSTFENMVKKYGDDAIIHITGGEPSTVGWLYPFLEKHGHKYRFHLNTNSYIKPPAKSVKRLKVSLDSVDSEKWNALVGVDGAWDRVVNNIREACEDTVVSITYTLSKKTIHGVVDFAKFCTKEFPGLYATFFSVYKGTDPEFMLDAKDGNEFFNEIMPRLLPELNNESRSLIQETIDEKRRLMEGVRFEHNSDCKGICFLSMSERVVAPNGQESTCSHLYRDGIMLENPVKHAKCKYGCNRRLVAFNEACESIIENKSTIMKVA